MGSRIGVWRARMSFTRSLVPMTNRPSRGWAPAISSARRMPLGVSIIAHTAMVVGAPAVSSSDTTCVTCVGALDLGHQDRIGAGLGDRRDVGLAPRRAEPVAADGDLALAVGAALGRQHDVGARGFLGLGRHGVLEIEDQRVGRQGPGLLQRARVGARHIEDAAARTDGLRHVAPEAPENAADYNGGPPCGKVAAACAFSRFRAMLPTAMWAIGLRPFPCNDWATRSGR